MNQKIAEVEYLNRLHLRISNLEIALFYYFAITKDILPPDMLRETERMFENLSYAQKSLHVNGEIDGPDFKSDKDLWR